MTTPETTRRRLLLGLAAASATAATASASQTVSAENPDLLALADDLPRHVGAFTDARDDVEWIVAEYAPQWPVPSEGIHFYSAGSKPYRSIDGRGNQRPWGKGGITRVPNVGTPECFEADYRHSKARADRCAGFKSQRGMKSAAAWAERSKRCIPVARDFWAEVDRLTAASGIKGAQEREANTQNALAAHVGAIMEAEALTMAGLVVKAQAMDAWSVVGPFHRALHPNANKWADAIATAILQLGGTDAS